MRIRRRVRRVVAWGLFFVTATLAGGGLCAYFYAMDSDNLVALVVGEAPRFLPDCRLTLSRVRVRPFAGEITLSHATLKRDTGGPAPTLVAMAPWLQLQYDPWAAMTEGRFVPRKVVVTHPLVRLRRMADGAWNVQGLLADPWPIPIGGATPPVVVENGTVELAVADDGRGTVVLREVSIRIPAGTGGVVAFEMTARGDQLDRVRAEGTFDPSTGRVAITRGDLARLSLSGPLRERLPEEARRALDAVGLEAGEIDATVARLAYDPVGTPRLSYDAAARLRKGAWKCPKLPFPIGDVSVDLSARDGVLTVDRAEGRDGATTLKLAGRLGLDDPLVAPFEIRAEAVNLELDRRLRRWTPEKFAGMWDVYFPKVGHEPSTSAGKVDVAVRASRKAPGAEVASVIEASCNDVSMEYLHFGYPLDHVRGTLKLEGKRMTLDLSAPVVGGGPLRVTGTVDDPGPAAVARLDFRAESLPIDGALLRALPPEVRKVVDDFQPAGSARGLAHLERLPPLGPDDDPRGRVAFHASIDLNPDCSITWKGLAYPVRNLTGKLEIHPRLWKFSEMRGSNGQATISAGGRIDEVSRGQFRVGMRLEARNLPFDDQLREALRKPWQVTWATLNPTGASDIDADIEAEPGRPEHYRVQITPRKYAGVKLQFDRPASAGHDGPTRIELRMDDVSGRFVFDTAQSPPTEMTDVGFIFQGAPVRFGRGQVDVKDSGQFDLGVTRLEVKDLRLDERLRRQMPPVMAQMARRLHDLSIPLIKGDLGLGWSGKAGESAWCRWRDALVVLNNNRVDLGAELSLDHIQGQVEQVQGWANGEELEVHGLLNLDSLSLLGQQLTRLGARLDVGKDPAGESKERWASLSEVRGGLLGGQLEGSLRASLDATPKYKAGILIRGADLRAYASTVPGHQPYRGLVSGWASVNGQGYDPHAIQASGEVRVEKGDLGTVPALLVPFFRILSLNTAKTAFDSAEVDFTTRNGETALTKVRIVGNALSLHGQGTLDVQGNLNLRLPLTYGRDSWQGPLLDAFRKLGGQLLAIKVQGPLKSPTFSPELVPIAGESVRAISRKEGSPRPGSARR